MLSRTRTRMRLALAAATLPALAAFATASGAHGANLVLGTTNTSNAPTTLTGNTAGPELLVKNANGSSAGAFSLYGLLTATAPTVNTTAVRGHNSATNAFGYGVYGSQAGAGTGVYGTTATGIGVYGRHLGSSGTGPGVEGRSAAAGGAGVLGYNSAGGPGLQSIVSSNAIAPLRVNSTHVVPNLHAANSDRLGGLAPSGYWRLGGNAPGTPYAVLGTTDNAVLELVVNGSRALRLEPNATSPNVIAGFSGNGNPAGSGAHGVVIAGGGRSSPFENKVTDDFGTVSGGASNVAGDLNGVASTAPYATVGGGYFDFALNAYATVGGGYFNEATGGAATVAGGSSNTAGGDWSFAAGANASANHTGSFVWGDASGHTLSSNGNNTVSFASTGGARFVTGYDVNGQPSTGVTLAAGGGSWSSLSDRAAKRNLVPVDQQTLLRTLNRVPISRWSYKSQKASIRHLGPMAQDFHAAFGLGEDNRHIDSIDSEGVALAAIQGLYRQNQALKRRNNALGARLTKLERKVAKLSR